MAKEIAPIILSCGVWDPYLSKLKVKRECFNTGVVAAIQKGSDTSLHPLEIPAVLCVTWYWYYNCACTVVGVTNCTADHLLRHICHCFSPSIHWWIQPYHIPSNSQGYCGITEPGLDFSNLQATIQHYYSQGLASSNHKCYRVSQLCYTTFCNQPKRTPILTMEMTLLLFIAHLAEGELDYTSIKVYLSVICSMHVTSSHHFVFSQQ